VTHTPLAPHSLQCLCVFQTIQPQDINASLRHCPRAFETFQPHISNALPSRLERLLSSHTSLAPSFLSNFHTFPFTGTMLTSHV
jgi:hypothetical protein